MFLVLTAVAQTINGTVTDAQTGEKLPFVNVYFDKNHGTQTNFNGHYSVARNGSKLTFSLVGYKTRVLKVKAGEVLDVKLEAREDGVLGEATVTGTKQRYSRKKNPAVDLMRKVIAAKKQSDLKRHPFYSIDKYSKTIFAFNDVTDKVLQEGKFKKFPFLKDHVETNNETGKLILPINVDETVSQEIFRQSPRSDKTIIKGKRSTGLNDLFYTGDIFTTVIQDCFTDVNIYEDDVRLLQYPFTSPISSKTAISFYRYFLVDTVMVDSIKTIHINFTPNNPQDFGFSGSLFIAADSSYRVVKCDLGIPGRSDVNYVENMRIIQQFQQLPTGEQVLVRDDMLVELKVVNFFQKFMVKRLTEYSNFSFEPIPEKTFKFRGDTQLASDALMKDDAFWDKYRSDPLTESEGKMEQLVTQLSQVKGFKPVLWVAKAFIENFVETTTDPKKGSKVDIGPINTIFSQNFVNGFRLRGSAQTTAFLNKHLFLKGYAAYGFKDRRVMGSGEITYSFLPKAYLPREFPVSNLSLNYTNDVMSPSDKFLPTDKDNVFTSFKWTKVNHMMYFSRWTLAFDREWENNLRFKVQLRHEVDEPTAALFYQPLNGAAAPSLGGNWQKKLTTLDATLSLTYSPGAKWVNTKQRRYSPSLDFPIFSISHTMGFKNLLGGDYAYNFTEASVYKRFWLHSWGKIDTRLSAGVQWNKVPYPLLIMPAANLSYISQDEMFSLIDNMEFLNDRYASLFASWDLNGKLFNRIPLLKKLKWRESFGCNVLWGDLTDKNNPLLAKNAADARLFYFPGEFHADGSFRYLSRAMDKKKPYVEIVAGIHNIFKIFHIEYVRRVTYTENLPTKRKWGIRGMFRVTF